MLFRKRRVPQRAGVVAVETALVIPIALMVIFGIYEYGRLILCWNALNNAAFVGCRYALVNNASPSINSNVTNVVTNSMAGLNTSAFTSFTVTVSGTHGGVSTPVNNLVPGDFITVTVTGTYKFMNIIPFITMGTTTISSAPTMVCEGVN